MLKCASLRCHRAPVVMHHESNRGVRVMAIAAGIDTFVLEGALNASLSDMICKHQRLNCIQNKRQCRA